MRIAGGYNRGEPRGQRGDVSTDRREEAFGIDAHPQYGCGDRGEQRPFAHAEIGHRADVVMDELAEHDAAVEVEHISGAEDDPGRRDKRDPARCLINAHDRQEFADKVARSRQADRGHGEQHEEQCIFGHVDRQAAIAGDLARVEAIVDDPDAQEERARDEAVTEHDHDRALDPLLVEGEQAGGDDAHMRDARIGDQFFHVRLRQRDEAGVDDRDHRQHENQPHEFDRGVGKHRQRKAQEAVAAHFEQHAGQDHRAGGRCLNVRIG